jgi:hypothetical protein
MDRIDRIRRGGKGEMIKRGRGIEKGMPCVLLLTFYPFTLLPSSPFLFILSILSIPVNFSLTFIRDT